MVMSVYQSISNGETTIGPNVARTFRNTSGPDHYWNASVLVGIAIGTFLFVWIKDVVLREEDSLLIEKRVRKTNISAIQYLSITIPTHIKENSCKAK